MEALIARMAEFVEDESEPGSGDIAGLTAALMERRISANPPMTLQQICINCIINNKENFLNKTYFSTGLHNPLNPFANLPNSVVQDLLEAVFSSDEYSTRDEIFCLFLLQLLNPLVLEFDYSRFEFDFNEVDNIFRHMLQNCPRIQKIKVSSTVWHNITGMHQIDNGEIMSLRWPNLTHLELELTTHVVDKVDGYVKYDNRVLKEVSKYFPILTNLVIQLGDLTLSDAAHITKMQKLRNLHLLFIETYYTHTTSKDLVSAIVQAAGGAPSLERFTFDYKYNENVPVSLHSIFVDMYGKLFGKKKLFIKQIRLIADLEHKWPECLSVEELRLLHCREDVPLLNLLSSNLTVQKLYIKEVPLNLVYSLVEKFGSDVTHLTIKKPSFMNFGFMFDPFRIISACSKLEHVRILISGVYAGSSNYEVTPQHFRNCSYFKMRRYINFVVTEICDLYKMFLLGSKKFIQELKVESVSELETLLWALNQEQHTCLDRVQDVSVKIKIQSRTIMCKVIQLVLLLAERSPFLKSVSLREQYWVEEPAWFRMVLQKLGIALEDTQSLINESDSEGPGYSNDDSDELDEEGGNSSYVSDEAEGCECELCLWWHN